MARYGNVYLKSLHVNIILYPSRFGRDTFQEAMKIVHRSESNIKWENFVYMVYDIPNGLGTYQERFSALCTYFFASLPSVLRLSQ